MSKQEEGSGPLAFTGLLAALPPPYPPYQQPSHEPLESQRIAQPYTPTTYGCHELVPPQPMESQSYAPSPPYSPQPLEFKCPAPGHFPLPLYYECRAPPYGYLPPYSPPYSPEPLESECRAPPQPLESECYAPSYAPATTYGGHSPHPLESECYPPPLTTDLKKSPMRPYGVTGLLGQIGLHCYNLHKGTNLQFLGVEHSYPSGIFGLNILLEAEDPIGNSTCNLDTAICYHISKGSMDLTVTRCLLQPEVEGFRRCNEILVVDDLFKGDMPNWMPEDALTGSDKLQYYEMKESEVEQDKEWLHLYAQLALFALGFFPGKTEPFELRKIVVQTKEDVKPKKKAEGTNAIFYISFKSSGGQDYNAIIRRTTIFCKMKALRRL